MKANDRAEFCQALKERHADSLAYRKLQGRRLSGSARLTSNHKVLSDALRTAHG